MSLLREVVGNFGGFRALSFDQQIGPVAAPIPRYDSNETVAVLPSDYVIVCTNNTNPTNVELPAPSENTGRALIIRHTLGTPVFSTKNNVIAINCSPTPSCAYTQILQSSVNGEAWAYLISNGEFWLITAGHLVYVD